MSNSINFVEGLDRSDMLMMLNTYNSSIINEGFARWYFTKYLGCDTIVLKPLVGSFFKLYNLLLNEKLFLIDGEMYATPIPVPLTREEVMQLQR